MAPYERHVFVCTHGDYCPFDGSLAVHRVLKDGVAALGLKGRVRVNKAGCFDQCGHGPMVVIYPEGVWYGAVDLDRARRILEGHVGRGEPVEDLVYRSPGGPNKNPARMAAIDKARASAAASGQEDKT